MPNFLPGGKDVMEKYFIDRIKNKGVITIKENDRILGYFSWIIINFHNEKSAFCPIIGHFGEEHDKENIYSQLYSYVSKEWVKNNIFNHLWMIHNRDIVLKKLSYDIGFGSYVIDACIKNNVLEEKELQYKIIQATKSDSEILCDLVEESRKYYLSSPIFLKRGMFLKDQIQNIIEKSIVFLAWNNNELIGVVNIRKNNEYDIEQLLTPGSVSIAQLGMYIKSNYRGKGIGKSLLNKVFQYCNENSIKYVHVCFETSNKYANKFWPRYFDSIILSIRRTINKDANV
jgi:predicted acetyltransferase